ncbi:MAG: TFIIB-type zinc ribbon-containing protein [Candidatus Woesearchaeota archaeon]
MARKDQIPLGNLKNEDKDKICPECGSEEIEWQHSELVCKRCGLVIE